MCQTVHMPSKAPHADRRHVALSKERILDAAIAILDDSGVDGDATGLTLRALMARLSTGSGAIYHYVANMDELRAEAADQVLSQYLGDLPADADPAARLRIVAAGIFDALDAHSWVGTQLTRGAFKPGAFRIWKVIGTELQRFGLTETALTDAGSALTNFMLGSAAQHNLTSGQDSNGSDRAARLALVANQWKLLDPDPLVADIANRLSEHDDREQFLAGVDIIVRGIAG